MTELGPALSAYCACMVALLGLCMGSFLNCLASRIVNGESVLHGRSHCMTCGHSLGARDLVPVVSWLSTRGKCRYCGERVSARYPATEVLCAVAYLLLFLRYGLSLEMVELAAFSSVLLVISLTDLDAYLIPNAAIVVALAIRLTYLVARFVMDGTGDWSPFVESLVGGVALSVPVLLLALVMDRVLGRDSLGGGDVKLFFVAGTYFGWAQGLFTVMTSCVLGIVFAALFGRGGDGEEARLIPFGPAIAAACFVTMLVGDAVLSWYLGLFF